jgi:hypothetical protein
METLPQVSFNLQESQALPTNFSQTHKEDDMQVNNLPSVDIAQRIHALERRHLDGAIAPSAPPVWGQIERVPFVRVLGQSAFWEHAAQLAYEQRMDDVLTSAHGQNVTAYYLIVGRGLDLGLYLGFHGSQGELILRTMLTGIYPGIELVEVSRQSLGSMLEGAGFFRCRGRLTGIPTRKSGSGAPRQPTTSGPSTANRSPARTAIEDGQQIERLMRGMSGAPWGYLVRAAPHPRTEVVAQAYTCLDEIAAIAAQTKRQFQEVTQTMTQVDPRTQQGSTRSVSAEVVNRQAEYAVTLLEKQLQRLDEGKAVGMWDVEVHLFSPDSQALARVQALANAVFAGPDSTPDPIRVYTCGESTLSAPAFVTQLTSTELAALTQLPREEVPGYRIGDYAQFDLDAEQLSGGNVIHVGQILSGHTDTGLTYDIRRDHLAKHGLVVGVTGSGKTTTVFGLLHCLYEAGEGAPFLVIEPAKSEYRTLRGQTQADGKGTGPVPDLRVYTLGDETVAPFRLNPFEFEIAGAEHRIHIQTHIDYLKSVFNAAFILYAPMPYVLETCLHEIYQDKGWDLSSGRNRRLPEKYCGQESQWPVFPTLTDLYRKIDEVTERLGYEERIEMDVKAGLKARVGSLRLGGKGLMLDTHHGVPISELLAHPTVLEMERIGNDDEKAFLIGLILTRLYEHRRVQAGRVKQMPALQHMTVIEEAHRLLKNVSTEVETEGANTRGQAVETFANMLSEIRAYGEGVLIAEQIPTKLAPDAIKNTNLKIIQRLVAQDDREVVGGTMNMDEAQVRFLATLPTGRAVVYAEGADHPYLVQVQNYKERLAKSGRPEDRAIALAMRPHTHTPLYDPLPGYSTLVARDTQGRLDVYVHDLARQVGAQPEFATVWAGCFLNLVLHPDWGRRSLEPLIDLLKRALAGQSREQQGSALLVVLLQATQDTLHSRGRHYDWSYDKVERLRQRLIEGLKIALASGAEQSNPALQQFAGEYRALCKREQGPFVGCAACREKCLYRHDVAGVVRNRGFEQEFVGAIQSNADDADLWKALATICLEAGAQLIGPTDPLGTANAALCIAVQMVNRLGFGQATQRKVASGLASLLFGAASGS